MLRRLWSALQSPIRQRGAAVFLSLAVAVGVIVGVAAAALIGAVQGLSDLVSWVGERLDIPKAIFFATIPLGFLTAWWIARRVAPEGGGGGGARGAGGPA